MRLGYADFKKEASILQHFTEGAIEIHGQKGGNDYLCKKHKLLNSHYAANLAMMTPAFDFVSFTDKDASYYKENNSHFLWVNARFLKDIIISKGTPNRNLANLLNK